MKVRSLCKRIASLLLCASLTGALFTGCKKGDDLFPVIESPEGQTGPSETADETVDQTPESDVLQLNVALPYSDLTIQCLASMLYCKNNGLWDSSDTGLTIDTDYLSSVATNYVVTNIGCGSTGAVLDTVREWSGKDEIPELFWPRTAGPYGKQDMPQTLTILRSPSLLFSKDRHGECGVYSVGKRKASD